MPSRHPSDERLMSFASGTLDEAFALVVNCHLQFCEQCTSRVRKMEDIGAALFDAIPLAHEMSFEQATMQRFQREIGHHDTPLIRTKADAGGEFVMPGPLARLSGLRRETIPWTHVGAGIRGAKVSRFHEVSAQLDLVSLDPGIKLPQNVHKGDHLILVLWGAYETEGGTVSRGDLHEIASGSAHSFSAASQQGVTCVIATDGIEQNEHARASI